MRSVVPLYSHWLICWGMSTISVMVWSHGEPQTHLGNWSTIYVDCNNGRDTKDCGRNASSPCKTLEYMINEIVRQQTSLNLEINIAPGKCDENGILRLDMTNVHSWSFIGSKETSKPPTVVDFSVEAFSSVVSFSYLTWRNSSVPISWNFHMSKVSFRYCTLQDTNFQFTGLNSDLVLQNLAFIHCTSQHPDIPLFFMQTLYHYNTSLFMQNSSFSYITRPIIYALQLQEIFIEDTLFFKNGKTTSSNSSMVTLSASSVILKDSIFNHTLGTAIEVRNVRNLTATKVAFFSNDGLRGSCLLIKRHSNVSLVDTTFQQNTNPVVFVKDKDGVNMVFQACDFDCIQYKKETELPFLDVPDETKITVTNCTIEKSCSVHCKNGERVNSHLYCEKCEAGHFSYSQDDIMTSDSCQRCLPGTYASHSGSRNCSLCSEGSYAQKSGSKECKKCTNDFFTSDAGAKTCSKLTLEFILILVATIPLIIIPLFLLLARLAKKRNLTLKARLHFGKNYNRFPRGQNVVQLML